jgi:hypothetical protein
MEITPLFVVAAIAYSFWLFNSDDDENSLDSINSRYMQASQLNIEDRLNLFKALVKEGSSSSLASFTWYCLLHGRSEEAIKLHEAYRGAVTHSAGNNLSYELANCDSNYALNLLAAGRPISQVKGMWDKNIGTGHAECIFYSRVAQIEAGKQGADSLLTLTKQVKKEMREILTSGEAESGWYKSWCSQNLAKYGNYLV